ncbi:MAG: GNAT family N-acetyltransferase [Paludibacterium sp.]|uniref:GNAT family N-acetyltransferase n=1 Tax=Paludibacterium sp. TaxID=1917523 RepID=UPI0025F2E8EA|nr:GNAT family N-acetyltransferase [Paludibacterium sp.]MBV8046094.1 GNAT family N-acetyltransferase [Paludibacterium sp.]MBV8647427.1 GNAT family N-acetyltransferase [Paludibacterium sp.]
MYRVATEDPMSADAVMLQSALSSTLWRLTGSSGRASFDPSELRDVRACFVVARGERGEPVGCGALRPIEPGIAEIKRMFALPGHRGVGRSVLAHLESEARRLGYEEIWLETREVNQRAVSFYERHGYVRIANYGQYTGRLDAACFGKCLPRAS